MGSGSGKQKRINNKISTPNYSNFFDEWPENFDDLRDLMQRNRGGLHLYESRFPLYPLDDRAHVNGFTTDELTLGKHYIGAEKDIYTDEELNFILTETMRDMLMSKTLEFKTDLALTDEEELIINDIMDNINLQKLEVKTNTIVEPDDEYSLCTTNIVLYYNDKEVNDTQTDWRIKYNATPDDLQINIIGRLLAPSYIFTTLWNLFDMAMY